MPIISTPAMIGGIVTYLGTKLTKNESISDFINEFTEASVNWIRPLFLKEDGSLQKELEKLKANPESKTKQNAVKAMIASELEDNPELEGDIKAIFDIIYKTPEGEKIINIINSRNVNTGSINAGGSVTIGDNNSTPK